MSVNKKSVVQNLPELTKETTSFLSLLSDPRPNKITWHTFLYEQGNRLYHVLEKHGFGDQVQISKNNKKQAGP